MMEPLQQNPRRQLEQFLSALFLPDEWIELRFIESWRSGGQKRSRVAQAAEWLRPYVFLARHQEITRLAKQERANVYFGVCPRPRPGDSLDDDIRIVRCLWCDIDDVTTDEAHARWEAAGVPKPSVVVNSGSGIHGYWLLDRDIQSPEERSLVVAMLPYFYHSFGGDHVQNLSRILRPPGSVNRKDERKGRTPRPCTLVTCRPEVRYPLTTFDRWIALAKEEQQPHGSRPVQLVERVSPDTLLAQNAEIAAIIRHLDKPSPDRSRRDFAVVCDLLRLGLTSEDIWAIVAGSSKFESNGRAYFDVTIANAEKQVLLDQHPARRTAASV